MDVHGPLQLSLLAPGSKPKNRPLPLLAWLLFFLTAGALHAQISPGPLSKAHHDLNGVTHCTDCHKIGASRDLKCIECHTEIGTRLANNRGFHAQVVPRGSGNTKCATCHSEHNGENFALIKWEPSQQGFDHSKTGWRLEGKHEGVACNRCHNATHVAASERASIRTKDLNRTFLGVPTTCATCHTDFHHGRLGQRCEQCHTAKSWEPTSTFDHSKARFPLTGAHVRVTCAKCHTPGEDGKPRWTGLAFARCADCHSDPHEGKFGGRCESCHSTASWHSVSTSAVSARFDHSTTKYPLLGKHATVACDACHKGGDFKKPLAFDRCTACHTPDPHNGQFASRSDKGECSACHTVEGFKPSLFTVEDHKKTKYPLEGKHAAVACEKCHIPAGAATLYRIKFGACTDCHKDIHLGQFQGPPHMNRCEDCHTVQRFRPATFTIAMHQRTRFELRDAHLATPCESCHKAGMTAKFRETATYHFDSLTCVTCHEDPHRNQFAERMKRTGSDGKPLGCSACHNATTWQDLARFNHNETRFKLIGSHRAVECIDCHKPPNLETNLAHVDFAKAPQACEECHADVHAAQFNGTEGVTRCASCHDSVKWKPSTFDHEKRTRFSLAGAHKNVACGKCHDRKNVVGGREVIFYKPTPTDCKACHGAEIKAS